MLSHQEFVWCRILFHFWIKQMTFGFCSTVTFMELRPYEVLTREKNKTKTFPFLGWSQSRPSMSRCTPWEGGHWLTSSPTLVGLWKGWGFRSKKRVGGKNRGRVRDRNRVEIKGRWGLRKRRGMGLEIGWGLGGRKVEVGLNDTKWLTWMWAGLDV